MREIDVPVLIVGGGGAGLTASNILARQGVKSWLIERHPSTSHLPKAHYLNQRSMEIFRSMDMAEAIYARGAPAANMGKIIWHTSLGGNGPLDAKVIYAADAMGGGRFAGEYAQKGVTRPVNIGQIWLEPILREFAEKANPGSVKFRHELLRFAQTDSGVEARVRDLESGEEYRVRSRYLIAADGGKTIAPALGIEMQGPTDLADYVGVYFRADLSRHIHDDSSVMRIILHTDQQPGRPPAGGLLAFGPERWDRHSEEWAVGWGYAQDDPARHDETNIAQRIQQFLKVDVPIEVIHVSHWKLEAVVAERFRAGRAFLVGDAAHRHTPGGGLGLNSAIQDVHNLCWKLALTLNGAAADTLLDTYQAERRPVVSRNAENSLLAFGNHSIFVAAMGLVPGAPPEVNQHNFASLFADTADGRQRRERLRRVFDSIVGLEYGPHDLEMGFQYDSAAVIQDGTPWPARDPLGSRYEPSGHPGCRLPHIWLHEAGRAVSTHDLIPNGGFLLLGGEDAGPWVAAAMRLSAQRNIRMRAARIGRDMQIADSSGQWGQLAGVESTGAILVRPDGHVAFRCAGAVDNPERVLRDAFDEILGAAALSKSARVS